MSEPAPSFQVRCECGHSNQVTALQAGTEIQCRCGKMIEVPSLNQLRKQAGLSDLRVSMQQRIKQAIAESRAKNGNRCFDCLAVDGQPANFFIECERAYVKRLKGSGIGLLLLNLLLFVFVHLLFFSLVGRKR